MESLQRFVEAQARTYEIALEELREGRKESHWMWYFFPQIDGLGKSAMSRLYSIKSGQEARDYLDHEILGKRLRVMTQIVIDCPRGIYEIFGSPDDLKFVSSMTLFTHFAGEGSAFQKALEIKNDGERDELTLEKLIGVGWS